MKCLPLFVRARVLSVCVCAHARVHGSVSYLTLSGERPLGQQKLTDKQECTVTQLQKELQTGMMVNQLIDTTKNK